MRDVIYHDRSREETNRKRKAYRTIAVVLVLVLVLLLGLTLARVGRDQGAQAIQSIRQNVTQAAVQCYAIEGRYPSDIAYLEENYGISYNAARYRVSLTPSQDGGLPDVQVVAR